MQDIRLQLDAHPHNEHLFIVLGSPVTEVGRDHDYDWAIVEPSSMRSLIQLAGRIRRHREGHITQPNLRILDHNLRHFEKPGKSAYCRPGFESTDFRLDHHDIKTLLGELLDKNGHAIIDACPRIQPVADATLRPAQRLIDLEHARLRQQMLPPSTTTPPSRPALRSQAAAKPPLNASSYWACPHASLTGLLQQRDPFRQQTQCEMDVVFLPDKDEQSVHLHRLTNSDRHGKTSHVPTIDDKLQWLTDTALGGSNIGLWGVMELLPAMREQAEAMQLPLLDFARKFATANLRTGRESTRGWRFHPALGFTLE